MFSEACGFLRRRYNLGSGAFFVHTAARPSQTNRVAPSASRNTEFVGAFTAVINCACFHRFRIGGSIRSMP